MEAPPAAGPRPASQRSVDSEVAREAVVESILAADSLYEVLQVTRAEAQSNRVLRKAYLKRSMECHPDKTSHPRATEAFQRVAEAYDTLGDSLKRAQYDAREQTSSPYNFRQHGDTVVMEMSADQAFAMFAQAMNQYAEEHGIEHERQTTIFDHLASAFLYVDGWINPQHHNPTPAPGSQRQSDGSQRSAASGGPGVGSNPGPEEEAPPETRLQAWARSLATMGSIVSTASQIIRVQRERERQEEEESTRRQGDGPSRA
ncbi:DnaJ protein-like [Hondaea fermentalgiana]|uniref:DnaJ protein-like n=1 Tax=Hondaea fermentalgiana TaxID=2315210 RepID=A0A2R5GC67_9STRA|nr:DnaJ protein-like [Hondaea fermentalgiana]|eukprot:GBG25751.1 DnaJ protein-like [Hondaea fermentalgiana]